MKVSYINLGCPKNQVDLEEILGVISDVVNIVEDPRMADVVIINTCAFIKTAKEESINVIFDVVRLKSNDRAIKILVTGCLPQRYRELLTKSLPEVDRFFSNTDAKYVAKEIYDYLKYTGKIGNIRKLISPSHYAYLKIADGCDNRCSYCAIPLIKGKFKSRPLQEVLEEAERLVSVGVKEIILIAQDTTQYGSDLSTNESLPRLLEALNSIKGLQWIRLLYTHPAHWSEELIDVIADLNKVCKYVDLPIQHSSNHILEKMRRRSSTHQITALLNTLRKKIPDLALRTSIIVGFPQETEKDFLQLLDFIKDVQFERLGVFIYSSEEGTPAFHFTGKIHHKIKEKRARLIMETQQEIALNKNQVLIGTDVNVIVDEKISEEKFIGRTSWDAPEIDNQVILTGKTEVGNIESVRVTGADSYDLIGEVIHSRICQEEKRHNVIGKISCQQKRAEITNYA